MLQKAGRKSGFLLSGIAVGVEDEIAPAAVPQIVLIDEDQCAPADIARGHLEGAGKRFLDGQRNGVACLHGFVMKAHGPAMPSISVMTRSVSAWTWWRETLW